MREAADAIDRLSNELECLKSYMGLYKAAYIKEHDARMMDYKSDKEQEASENWKLVLERVGEPQKVDPCADCVHYPPSSTDGKPCCACDPANPLTNCHEAKEVKDERI